mmetsp:Transcript_24265/g.62216  ORF Transcript_24265/g.62216 Transcript_24265/m.62216 type:complete len:265 (+) Transcript_24265:584-1378(+)
MRKAWWSCSTSGQPTFARQRSPSRIAPPQIMTALPCWDPCPARTVPRTACRKAPRGARLHLRPSARRLCFCATAWIAVATRTRRMAMRCATAARRARGRRSCRRTASSASSWRSSPFSLTRPPMAGATVLRRRPAWGPGRRRSTPRRLPRAPRCPATSYAPRRSCWRSSNNGTSAWRPCRRRPRPAQSAASAARPRLGPPPQPSAPSAARSTSTATPTAAPLPPLATSRLLLRRRLRQQRPSSRLRRRSTSAGLLRAGTGRCRP